MLPASCPTAPAPDETVYPAYDFYGQVEATLDPSNGDAPDTTPTTCHGTTYPTSYMTCDSYGPDGSLFAVTGAPVRTGPGTSTVPSTTYSYDHDRLLVSTTLASCSIRPDRIGPAAGCVVAVVGSGWRNEP